MMVGQMYSPAIIDLVGLLGEMQTYTVVLLGD